MSNHLDPDHSPDLLNNSASHLKGVRRLNKLPLLIVFFIVALIMMIIFYTIVSRGKKEPSSTGNTDTAIQKQSNPKYLIDSLLNEIQEEEPSPKKEKPLPAGKPIVEKTVVKKMTPPAPIKPPAESKLQKMRNDMLNDAILSNTAIANSSSGSNNKSPASDNPLSDGSSASLNLVANTLKEIYKKPSDTSKISTKNALYVENAKSDFSYSTHTKVPLLSPYEIKTGTIIPGILITGMNSELPGPILAQVSENVYDTATGRFLLIPQGTKIIGAYSDDVSYGQSRILVVWKRLVFPDGQTLNLDAMQGVDKQGYSGFSDKVDNHYFRIFGSAFLLSIIGGEILIEDGKLTFATGKAESNLNGAEKKESLLEKTGVKMIEKNMGLAPTLEIRPGYKFNIFVNKDMMLEPLPY